MKKINIPFLKLDFIKTLYDKIVIFFVLFILYNEIGDSMKIINTLTKRHLLKNKKRTLVTLIAVILTSTLLFSIGFAYSTYRANEINRLKQTGNDYEAKVKNIPFSKRKLLDENKDIKNYEYISKVYDTDYLAFQSGSGDKYLEVYTITDGIKFDINMGRLPQNDSEILIPVLIDSKIGSTLELNVTDYDGNHYKKEYKIVGIINSFNEDMLGKIFTKDNKINENANTYFNIYLKTRKNAYEKLFRVAKTLGLEETYEMGEGISYKNMEFNTTILELSGNYRDFAKRAIIYVSLMIILAVISIASAIIIYNSFSISLADRKKQIGILKSVGMTKKQIRKLIFKEAFYISIIAIPLGFLISYLFVLGIVNYINFIQNGARTFILKIDISYLLMSLIFIILTIIYSAFFPAMRASEITPIEAIRQSKDIKVKRNRKTIFSKLFGIYGFMASANMKRNKHKYKTAIIGSVISMVLFMTVATFINFTESGIDSYYDVVKLYSDEIDLKQAKEDIKEITNSNIVTDYFIMENKYVKIYGNFEPYYTDEYKKRYTEPIPFFMGYVIMTDDNFYNKIKSKYKINNDNPIYINYLDNINVFQKDSVIDFKMCNDLCDTYTLNLIDEIPGELKKFDLDNLIIVNEETFYNIKDQSRSVSIFILSSDNMELDKQIKDFLKKTNYSYSYTNNVVEYIQEINDMKCMKIVLYTLIILFAFISITSIINTISASMHLRKREFAILKSVGLDNKGFNKILILESLLLSVKTIIYGTIFSSIVIYLIRNTFNLGYREYTLAQIFPINYYIITIIVIFVSITLTIFTQLGKLKEDNIISNIKNENI